MSPGASPSAPSTAQGRDGGTLGEPLLQQKGLSTPSIMDRLLFCDQSHLQMHWNRFLKPQAGVGKMILKLMA